MNVMLLAAGEGTRLRPYTNILPKPAIPFLNIPLAAHALHFLGYVKISKLVVNTFHLPGEIHKLFHSLPKLSEEIIFSDESGEILGSGGGLAKAATHFKGGGHFIMMNADEVILPKVENIMAQASLVHTQSKALATLMVKDHPGVGTQFGGVWVDANNKVLGFGKTAIPGSVRAWHFVGVQILSENVFRYLPASGVSNILYDALAAAIAVGELVQAFPFECQWFETGNPQDFMQASAECFEFLSDKNNSVERPQLEERLNKFSKSTLESIGGGLLLKSSKSQISPDVKVSGFACVGENSIIGKSCSLENVIVGRAQEVSSGSALKETILISKS